jgi:hypothetical protein
MGVYIVRSQVTLHQLSGLCPPSEITFRQPTIFRGGCSFFLH